MRRRLFGMACALALLVGLAPASALAAEGDVYVALGDSVAAGYGVGTGESYPELVAAGRDYELRRHASSDGYTSDDLVEQLGDESVAADVAAADVVTITVGGNDVMGALYDYLAEKTGVPASLIEAALAGSGGTVDLGALQQYLPLVGGFAGSEQARGALADLSANLGAALAAIASANPDATVVVTSQYNPYGHLAGSDAIETIVSSFEDGVAAMNAAIDGVAGAAAAQGLDVSVADAHGALAASDESPCNAAVTGQTTVNLDFHPNALGHELIAAAVDAELPAAEDPGTPEELPFDDVLEGQWYTDAVRWAWESGVMGGYGGSVFGVGDPLTRAQMAGVLYNIAGQPEVPVISMPGDCDPDEWYAECVTWALATGVFNGYGDGSSFGPDAPLTREQAAAVIMRAAGLLGADVSGRADLSDFPDADDVSSWATEALSWAVANGVINGVELADGTRELQPGRACTRAEMAGIMMNLATRA